MDKQVFHGLKLGAYCGAGGYGEVRLCEDISGRQMAVKIINKKGILITIIGLVIAVYAAIKMLMAFQIF